MVKRNPRALARDWSATDAAPPWSDMNGRLRLLVEDGEFIPKSAGRHSAVATPRVASVVALAPLVAPRWTDVPAGIRRYGGLMASSAGFNEAFPSRFGEEICRNLHAQFENQNLLQALAFCLQTFHSGSK